ncbi:MAG: CMD domain protein [Lautropia sp.]
MTIIDDPDVIDRLVGAPRAARIASLRALRPDACRQSEQAYRALFDPGDTAAERLSRHERFAVAYFVALVHRVPDTADHYRARLADEGASDVVTATLQALAECAAIEGGAASIGPWGCYPPGPLQAESRPGPIHYPGYAVRRVLGERLAAAIGHAHLLVLRPRESAMEDLHQLQRAGWSDDAIVTLSQLISFLTYQLRIVSALQALAEET